MGRQAQPIHIDITEVVRQAVARFPVIVAAYLFGSRAAGTHAPGSDFDVLFLLADSEYDRNGCCPATNAERDIASTFWPVGPLRGLDLLFLRPSGDPGRFMYGASDGPAFLPLTDFYRWNRAVRAGRCLYHASDPHAIGQSAVHDPIVAARLRPLPAVAPVYVSPTDQVIAMLSRIDGPAPIVTFARDLRDVQRPARRRTRRTR